MYMNLAELSLREGNFDKAISLYETALKLAPDRGLAYIRLGQIVLDYQGDVEGARKIWRQGLQKTIDTDAKAKLKLLIENN